MIGTSTTLEVKMADVIVNDASTDGIKNTARMLYLVHAATFFFSLGMLNLIPLIINYVKRGEAAGTWVYSHHNWMIRSFWIYVVLMAVGWMIMLTLGWVLIGIPIAILIWCGGWIWEAYRLIRGFIDLNENKAMPD
jgi:uncharacterized membrane protein